MTVTPKPTAPWAAQGPLTDLLLAVFREENSASPGVVICRSHITLSPAGVVSIIGGLDLAEIEKIEVGTDVAAFNRYIAEGTASTLRTDAHGKRLSGTSTTTRTVALAGLAYDGVWHYRINSLLLGDDRTLQARPMETDAEDGLFGLWAIPRVSGENIPALRKRDAGLDAPIATALINAAHDKGIPPQLLQAIT